MTHDNNGGFVSWGRYDAEHRALEQRVGTLERLADGLRGSEVAHKALSDRISAIELTLHHDTQHEDEERNRRWLVIAAVISGFILPLVVSTVVTLLHLHTL